MRSAPGWASASASSASFHSCVRTASHAAWSGTGKNISFFSSAPKPACFVSSERSAFWKASLNVRPMAIASPTDFICVPRCGSAAGNFSNVKRGTFTTT